MKYYIIVPDEGGEEIMVVGKVDTGISVLIHTFAREEEEDAREFIDLLAKSPNYLWDLTGNAKILRSYIKEITKTKKTGKPIPFYYAVLLDGEQFPIAKAQDA
jgi:hypothetical protein